MLKTDWKGVFPAITTPFRADGSVDHEFLSKHCAWLLENGCRGVVALGSLGEGSTLRWDEKLAALRTVLETLKGKAPTIAGISSLGTNEAIDLAKAAEQAGCEGLMVLPPYVYVGDWRETKAYIGAVLRATPLSAMLYNNPIAYQTDFLAGQIAELAAEHHNLHAVKESSADVRRIAALRSLIGDRLQIFCGVDDLIVEAIYAGATGWIAGLVNAFPRESVELFELATNGQTNAAFDLYKWFLPLLRFDVVPKFVQLIKYTQELVGMGSGRVRAPRLELAEDEKRLVQETVQRALAARPAQLAAQGSR
ncbi:MAG: dihydrodipicolinate synthase family protein [Acidobacteriaceae bacterium]|nr:dihydrodipicolinate synthase family protein [Acidobacteriaceae bacterium]